MVTVIALLEASPGHETKVESELRSFVLDTSCEEGVSSYFISRDPQNRERLAVYERYTDASARDAHFASAHLRAALGRLEPLLAEAPTVLFLDEIAAWRERE